VIRLKEFKFPSGQDYSLKKLDEASYVDSRRDKRIAARKRRRFFRINAIIICILAAIALGVGYLYHAFLITPYTCPLYTAVNDNDFDALYELYTDGFDLNQPILDSERGAYYPAVVIAVRRNNYEMVNALFEFGADINVVFGAAQSTPLHLAAELGTSQMVDSLFQRGADIYALNRDSKTPLHLAVNNLRPQVLALLLEHTENPDPQCQLGWTPLHRAAQAGRGEMLTLLIEAGADVNAQTLDGWTPLRLAENAGNVWVVELLSE